MALAKVLCMSLGLAQLVVAQPTGQVESRQEHIPEIIIFDSKAASPTRVREVIVWVDEAGEPLSTTTDSVLLLPESLAPGEAAKSSASTTTMTPYCTQTLPAPSPDVPALGNERAGKALLPASSVPIVTSKTVENLNVQDAGLPSHDSNTQLKAAKSFGVSYSPYRGDQGCKSRQDVENDFERMSASYSHVRIYGTDCDQVASVYAAAKAHGMKLFLGIWNPSTVQKEADDIVSGIQGDWDMVRTISVGNELVNNGAASPQDLIRSMDQARSILRAAGYNGPVVIVDTFRAVMAHPQLCEASDYCAVNAHAFFDGTIRAQDSGNWLNDTVSGLRSTLSSDKKIVITETGWPTQGAANGVAIPSLQNQKLALDSIKEVFANSPEDVILFSAFNDLWKKKSMATFQADQFWGIDGAVSSCDQ